MVDGLALFAALMVVHSVIGRLGPEDEQPLGEVWGIVAVPQKGVSVLLLSAPLGWWSCQRTRSVSQFSGSEG